MANPAPSTPVALSFYELSEADKANHAYWAIDRACAGEATLPGDEAALLFAQGLVDRVAQALRAALPKGGAA